MTEIVAFIAGVVVGIAFGKRVLGAAKWVANKIGNIKIG